MLNTTPISSLESITSDLLVTVSGGCGGGGCHHRHCCAPAAPVTQQTIVNMPPQILPQAAPAAPAPAAPSDVVTTNVSVNGQPASA